MFVRPHYAHPLARVVARLGSLIPSRSAFIAAAGTVEEALLQLSTRAWAPSLTVQPDALDRSPRELPCQFW